MDTEQAVKTVELRRRFRRGREAVDALNGISLEIQRGEFFGVLGRNGAGKTTFLRILATLLHPTSGRALVGGHDVVTEGHRVRQIINLVSGGETTGYGILTLRENLWMFSQLYGIPSRQALDRIDRYLERFGLRDQAKARVSALSSGMKQKMNLIRGLLNDPEILFLDEPTVNLDVESAREIRSFLKEWVREGRRTVLLTTHNLFEAEELSDRLAVIENGQVMALATPAELKAMSGSEIFYELTVRDLPGSLCLPAGQAEIRSRSDGVCLLNVRLEDDSQLPPILQALGTAGASLVWLRKREPTLEDAFVHLVGKAID
ncbi:MAG TPA: ABC transporter ATP-binding protein [Bryobacteraceae bacterium]|nr:ABC transporter ATP-binding protein [Bryobacteraceae bacterium]